MLKFPQTNQELKNTAEYVVFGEGSQISINQKQESIAFSLLIGSNMRPFPKNTVLYSSIKLQTTTLYKVQIAKVRRTGNREIVKSDSVAKYARVGQGKEDLQRNSSRYLRASSVSKQIVR